jgi:SSS family solute:Na+ symporter
MVGAALFASNISTIHLVGLSASGFNEGFVWGNFEWMASLTLILLGLVFAPFYFKSRISTLLEFLEKRYNSTARSIMAFIAIIGALFVHIGMSLYAGAVVFHAFFGINVITSIVVISVITAIYTLLGGLKAVVVTETIQAVILIIGAIILTSHRICHRCNV